MYAAGLRVSELVGLPANAVNLRRGIGAGDPGRRDRLVPLGEPDALAALPRRARPALDEGASRRAALDPPMFLGPRPPYRPAGVPGGW